MTVSKNLEITCNGCHESEVWSLSVLRNQKLASVLENAGYVTESESFISENDHYCLDCNDRETETFHVYDGYGDEYLGTVEAWGIVDARREAWDTYDQENMVKRERIAENEQP